MARTILLITSPLSSTVGILLSSPHDYSRVHHRVCSGYYKTLNEQEYETSSVHALFGDVEHSDAADAELDPEGARDGDGGGTSYEPLREQHEPEQLESEKGAAASSASASNPVEAGDSKCASMSSKWALAMMRCILWVPVYHNLHYSYNEKQSKSLKPINVNSFIHDVYSFLLEFSYAYDLNLTWIL